jgi:sterol desaturase/sphingolipid hydroxylase (fatty acid hydroxylase superfamily)
MDYLQLIIDSYTGYGNYLWREITQPSWHNYLYWLVGISLFFFLVEWLRPWHRQQPAFRKDFWQDVFYMFFNFFLFSLIIYNAASDMVVRLFNDALEAIGIPNLVAFEVMSWPIWAHLLLGFVVRDFVQWWIHRLLHRVPALWEFHKVHHSVEQMVSLPIFATTGWKTWCTVHWSIFRWH